MRHKKSCPTCGSLQASTSSSSSSSVSSSLSSSFTSIYSPPSPHRPLCSPPHDSHIIELPSSSAASSSSPFFPLPYSRTSGSKHKSTRCTWASRLFQLGKLSMEAEEGFLLQQRALEGVLYVDGKLAEEKPKKELRFAAKIAVAMDADGFIGVKNSVCADDALIEVKHSINDSHYCVPSPSSSSLQRKERLPPSKQMHPLRCRRRPRLRQWKLFRRLRRTRVLFACLFRKVTRAFASSSKRTIGAHDKFIK